VEAGGAATMVAEIYSNFTNMEPTMQWSVVQSVITSARVTIGANRYYTYELSASHRVQQWRRQNPYSGNNNKYRYYADTGSFGCDGIFAATLTWGNNSPPDGDWGPPKPVATRGPSFVVDGVYYASTTYHSGGPIYCGGQSGKPFRWYVQDRLMDPTTLESLSTEKRYFSESFGCDPSTENLFDFDPFENFESLEFDPSTLDPSDSHLTSEELRDLIGNLKDTPWYDKYADKLPKVGEPHPSDPDWPCGPKNRGPDVPRLKTGPGGFRVPREPGFDPPVKPGDEMCVEVGGKVRCGKVRRVPPPGEDIIVEEPPYRDEKFTKDFCPKKGSLIVDLVKQLATELGFDPGDSGWVVDSDCQKRWPGGCFRKGSSKFDAMWRLADMCGDVFNPDEPQIGKIKPLPPDPRTYGPYHEHRDLFVFEATQDDLDIPSHVEVYVPHYPGRRGYSVIVKVDVPYGLRDKYLRIRAPKGMTEADAMDWAANKAREYEILANLVDYAIPYNEYVAFRHQQMLRVPSEGYDGRFMVWEFSHDIDVEEGAVTKIRGVRLQETRYAPRFESYEEVWADSGIMS